MSLASDYWNVQPDEKRKQLTGILLEHKIRDLKAQRKRMFSAFNAELRVVDKLIASSEHELIRWEREITALPANEEG